MKRVIHITDSASRLAGGMFESVRGLSNGLGKRNLVSSVMAFEDAYSGLDRAVWGESLKLIRLSRSGPIISALQMAAAIRNEKPSVVHLHGIWGPSAIAVRRLLHISPDIPIIVSPRGMLEEWALRRSRLKKFIAWFGWTKMILHRATLIHALCQEELESIRKIVKNVPVAIIPNGIQLPIATNIWASRRREVLFLGRISSQKRDI